MKNHENKKIKISGKKLSWLLPRYDNNDIGVCVPVRQPDHYVSNDNGISMGIVANCFKNRVII